MERLEVSHGDTTLSVLVGGEGPEVVLLHGWPDTAELWEEVAAGLVAGGCRVIAPDLRGCGRSSKPEATSDYDMSLLVGDVIAVMDALGAERATVVGHDWGAALAWALAAFAPARVERLVALSVGHPTAFRSGGIAQQVRSWYTLIFAHAGLGERFLRHRDYEVIRQWMGHPRPDEVIAELERDGQMSAHLRWYRANLPLDAFFSDPPSLPSIVAPVLGIWSSADPALTEEQMTSSAAFCTGGFTYVRLDRVGHWIPLEAPAELVHLVTEFLGRGPASS